MGISKPVIIGIIQCRTGSTRLPKKALLPLAGQPMIQRYIQRCKKIKGLHNLVLATTLKPEDNILCEIARLEGIEVFRGSENDLVDRYYQCALKYGADLVVRLCSDNPLIEPEEVDNLIGNYKDKDCLHTNAGDFQSITDGLGAEIYSLEALKWLNEVAVGNEYREHPHKIFMEMNMVIPVPLTKKYPRVKLDVNTQDEYEYVKQIYDKHGDYPHADDYMGGLI